MPSIVEAFNLALRHHQNSRLREAETLYRQILQVQPQHPDVLHLLGVLAHQQNGRDDIAIEYISRAIALNPSVAEFHNNLGNALQYRSLEKAVACYQQALALKPGYAEAYNNLGNVLQGLGHAQEAVSCYRQALALNPTYAEACNNLGIALQHQGLQEEAVTCYRRALALKPDYAEAENQLMHQLQRLCEWASLNELFDRQRRRSRSDPSARLCPFTFLSIPSSSAEQLACSRNWTLNKFSSYAWLSERREFSFTRTPKPTLRIGYLSADFRQHAIAYLIAELFELHNRNCVEVFAYSIGPDDGSEMRKRLARACDRFVDVRAMSSVEAARRMYGDGIDLLIDLGGYTAGGRAEIAALRPAPIQVNWLGYPGTMGAEFIDYIVTDRFITPPDQEPYFSEKCVYLPDCYQINDRKRTIARRTPTRKECGLPEKGFVFCCFNNSYKITPAVFDVWMRLLKNVPGSVLWLLEANSRVAANLRREAKVRGANPDRLVFAPRMPLEKHLARHRVADLFLDTVPYNAHTTASDALWVGLPVLTCAGETFASRVAGSLLTAIGLPELITRSLADYEALALRLARHPGELAGLRKRVAKNRLTAPLFDSERFTQHLERAYQTMWEIYLKGEAPKRIEVPALPPKKRGSAKRPTTRKA